MFNRVDAKKCKVPNSLPRFFMLFGRVGYYCPRAKDRVFSRTRVQCPACRLLRPYGNVMLQSTLDSLHYSRSIFFLVPPDRGLELCSKEAQKVDILMNRVHPYFFYFVGQGDLLLVPLDYSVVCFWIVCSPMVCPACLISIDTTREGSAPVKTKPPHKDTRSDRHYYASI